MFKVRAVSHISDDAFAHFFDRIKCIYMCL